MFFYDADNQTVSFSQTTNGVMKADEAQAWAAVQQTHWLREIAERLEEVRLELSSLDMTISGK